MKFLQRPSGIGARALARFNVRCGWTHKIASPLELCEVKRRERRAPARIGGCHSISRFSITEIHAEQCSALRSLPLFRISLAGGAR